MPRRPQARVVIRPPARTGAGPDGDQVIRGDVLHTVEIPASVPDADVLGRAMAEGLADRGYDATLVVNKEVEEVTTFGVEVADQ